MSPKRKAAESSPSAYVLASRPIRCPHCGEGVFRARDAQLNTAFATLLNLDWTDRSARILTCARCGRIQWFADPPTVSP